MGELTERGEERRDDERDGANGVLSATFGGILLVNAAAVFALPDVLGYPMGGHFLLTALPIFGLSTAVMGIGVAVFAVARRTGFWIPALVSLGLLGMAVGNGWLWILCVSSV